MAHIGCPCGGRISNTSDRDEMEYYFMANDILDKYRFNKAFFDIQYSDLATEIWKCHVCDRLLFFENDDGTVSRYMKRIDPDSISTEDLNRKYVDGICYNNLLFNEVDGHFTQKSKRGECPEYNFFGEQLDGPTLLTPDVMYEEVFSHKNGWFLNWWRARLYDDYLVFLSPHDYHGNGLVKAWQRYEQIWDEAD